MLSTQWTKSSRSGHTGACVEARLHAGGVETRDSKGIAEPSLRAKTGERVGLISMSQDDRN